MVNAMSRVCGSCKQTGHNARTCKAEAGAGRIPRTMDESPARTPRTPMPMPYLTADHIEYRCLTCGYRGWLSEQTEHRATHNKARARSEAVAPATDLAIEEASA